MLGNNEKSDEALKTVVSFSQVDIESDHKDNVLTSIISPHTGKEVKITGDVDEAMKYAILNKENHIEIDPKADRRLKVKLFIYVLPLMCILYCFQFMDKLSNSYASILGLREGLDMTPEEYSWTGSAFYLGYLVAEFPMSFLLQKFPIIKTVSVFIILWGVIICLGSVCTNSVGFLTVRTAQGMAESIISPCFVLYTTFWFTNTEIFYVTSLWFSFNGLGVILGSGAIAYNIFKDQDSYSLAPYKVVFLTVGVLTIFLGFLFALHLPDTPAKAWFLNDKEKALVVERIRGNQQGYGNKHFKIHQVKEALLDVKVWLFCIFSFVNNIPNGGITNFGSILLNSDLGYSTGDALLMQMPSGAVELVGCTLFAYFYKFYPNRMLWASLGTAIVVAAQCMLAFGGDNNKLKLAGYSLYSLSPIGFICLLSSISSNILGTTKKQTASALMLVFYCVGNLVGPQTFKADEAPSYTLAKLAIVICGAISLVTLLLIWAYYVYENKRRDALGITEVDIENIEFADLTDKENPLFRYVL